jgi:hypothetical protein
MTDDERKKLEEAHKKVNELHDAFFGIDQLNERPLIKRIGSVVVAVERGSWGLKVLSKTFFYVGALFTTAAIIKAGIMGWKN